jgi:hypothetical protein
MGIDKILCRRSDILPAISAAYDCTDGKHQDVKQLVPPVVPPGILQLGRVVMAT